ncbi:MAG TPA: carbohydrate ABC transporter permease [Gaiellaceae bacterium]|jgi:multiple sugar transport system permease protein|nr:carbohydrate ABC transporter permease [Gaiellaceae bacterium]
MLLLSTAFLVFLPYLWMLTTSLKPPKLTFAAPHLIPAHFVWENYRIAWEAAPFDRFYVNSIVMAVAIAVGQVLTSAMAGYAFDRLEFPFKNVLFFVFLAALMIPLPLLLIPSYLIVRDLGWLNSYAALIVPRLWTPFGVLLMRQYFRTLPRELDDAALVDGSTRFGVLFRILFPLSRPAVAALGLFAFLFAWNDFLWPLIVLDNPDKFTIQVGLAQFAGKYGTQWTSLMAGTVTATLPVLVLFILLQRWIIRGMTLGALNE